MKFSVLFVWIVLLLFVLAWGISGGLWERKEPTLDFRKLYRQRIQRVRSAELTNAPPDSPYVANQVGTAESIRNTLFGGTAIPGWSTAPVEQFSRKSTLPLPAKQQEQLKC